VAQVLEPETQVAMDRSAHRKWSSDCQTGVLDPMRTWVRVDFACN
jgi:hypothetical protein